MEISLESISRKVKSILIRYYYAWGVNVSACAGIVDIHIMANGENRTWLDVDLFKFMSEDSEVFRDMVRFSKFVESNHPETITAII